MGWWRAFCVGMAASLAAGCMSGSSPPPALSQRWMIGVEHMRDDPLMLQPFTNRFLAVLAGMPKTQVVYLGADRNDFLFGAYTADKLRVHPWLRAEGNCMEITYTIDRAGQQEGSYGLVVPALPAGSEPDAACVERAASSFYRTLVRQGL